MNWGMSGPGSSLCIRKRNVCFSNRFFRRLHYTSKSRVSSVHTCKLALDRRTHHQRTTGYLPLYHCLRTVTYAATHSLRIAAVCRRTVHRTTRLGRNFSGFRVSRLRTHSSRGSNDRHTSGYQHADLASRKFYRREER